MFKRLQLNKHHVSLHVAVKEQTQFLSAMHLREIDGYIFTETYKEKAANTLKVFLEK